MLCEAAQAGWLISWQWQGKARAALLRTDGALCQPLGPAHLVRGHVTPVDVATAARSSAGRPPRGRMQAWTLWALSAKGGWTRAVVAGTLPASLQWGSRGLSRSRISCGQ